MNMSAFILLLTLMSPDPTPFSHPILSVVSPSAPLLLARFPKLDIHKALSTGENDNNMLMSLYYEPFDTRDVFLAPCNLYDVN